MKSIGIVEGMMTSPCFSIGSSAVSAISRTPKAFSVFLKLCDRIENNCSKTLVMNIKCCLLCSEY